MDFVVAYCERWDTPLRTSKHHIVSRLLKEGHRVIYIETPINFLAILKHPKEFINHQISLLLKGPIEVERNLWVMTGLVPFPYHPALFGIFDKLRINSINQNFFFGRLQKVIFNMGFKEITLINYYPLLFPIIDKIGFKKIVFHIVDEWQGMSGIPKSMATLTQDLVKRADVATIVTSQNLFDRYKKDAREIHLLRHGTDWDLFSPVAMGKKEAYPYLASLPGKKIGYYGALHKLNFSLIIEVATLRPDWSFVFLGPIKGPQGLRMRRKFPSNVYFLEAIPREFLPNFLAGIDVFWMPFLVNELTKYMSPIKLYEVLSAGLPVVSSDLEECRAVATECTYFADSPEDHITYLTHSMCSSNSGGRKSRSMAMRNTDWNGRFSDFMKIVKN